MQTGNVNLPLKKNITQVIFNGLVNRIYNL